MCLSLKKILRLLFRGLFIGKCFDIAPLHSFHFLQQVLSPLLCVHQWAQVGTWMRLLFLTTWPLHMAHQAGSCGQCATRCREQRRCLKSGRKELPSGREFSGNLARAAFLGRVTHMGKLPGSAYKRRADVVLGEYSHGMTRAFMRLHSTWRHLQHEVDKMKI